MKWFKTKREDDASLICSLKAANKEQAEVIEKFFEQSAEQLEKIKGLERELKILRG